MWKVYILTPHILRHDGQKREIYNLEKMKSLYQINLTHVHRN
jgi:hypothetical protein